MTFLRLSVNFDIVLMENDKYEKIPDTKFIFLSETHSLYFLLVNKMSEYISIFTHTRDKNRYTPQKVKKLERHIVWKAKLDTKKSRKV